MRKLTWILAALAALAVASVAVAHDKLGTGVTPAKATFTAKTATDETKTCTAADGSVWHLTHATYKGTSTGDPQLTGNLTLRTRSLINTTTGFGWTKGEAVVRDATTDQKKARGEFIAVNTQSGILNGFLTGSVRDTGRLLANFSAAFTADGSSLSGELGGTSSSSTDSAVYAGGSGCDPSDDKQAAGDDDHGDKKHEDGKRGDKKKGGEHGSSHK
jgi:hypothetical protein